ncbi:MAG: VOC family protein [Chitinophagaceae bacterium]|nr:MAG: VOC family protein [Chitinophagaceae bacterium]
MKEFKPAGYSTVSPYLIVDGARELIDLLKKLFGADEIRCFDRPDGSVMHAEVKIQDSVIMIADANDEFEAVPAILHVYVADADATYEKAISLGCTELEKPKSQADDPDRRGSFIDFAGNMWSVGTQL